MNITLGRVVLSKSGRDSGKMFIVCGIIDQNYVLISDGDLRRIEKPKRKKVKHLEITDKIVEGITEKIEKGIKVSNSEVRKSIAIIKDCSVTAI